MPVGGWPGVVILGDEVGLPGTGSPGGGAPGADCRRLPHAGQNLALSGSAAPQTVQNAIQRPVSSHNRHTDSVPMYYMVFGITAIFISGKTRIFGSRHAGAGKSPVAVDLGGSSVFGDTAYPHF